MGKKRKEPDTPRLDAWAKSTSNGQSHLYQGHEPSRRAAQSDNVAPKRDETSLVAYVTMPYKTDDYPDAADLLLTESARRAHEYYGYADNPEAFNPDSVCDDIWFCALNMTHKEAVGIRNSDKSTSAFGINQAPDRTTEHTNGKRRRAVNEDAPGNGETYVGPRVEINGVTPDGTTICVVADNFEPYCYASIPQEWVDFCQDNLPRLQRLCLRWYSFMDEFFMRVVMHMPGFKRYRSCLCDGHVLLPLTQEERRRGIVLSDVKDIKCAYMDYKATDPETNRNKPKHLTHYVVKLRVASPKLITLVRQHLWYPQGVDGSVCALCGGNHPDKPRINSPFISSNLEPENLLELLGEEYLSREKRSNWTGVVRDKCGCAARFHGQCLRMWARAQRLRADLPDNTEYILRCPCCTSDVITIAHCQGGFTRPKSSLPSLEELCRQESLRNAPSIAGSLRSSHSSYSLGSSDDSNEGRMFGGLLHSDRAINPWGRNSVDNLPEMQGSTLLADADLLYDERSSDLAIYHSYRSRSNTGTGGDASNSIGYSCNSNDSAIAAQSVDCTSSIAAEVPWQDDQDLEDADDVGLMSDGWNDQGNLYGWYGEFARSEQHTQGCFPPAPQPTEAQELEAKLRAQVTGTIPYPPSMTVCDAKVGFCERFSIDRRIAPTQWTRVMCGKYVVIPPDDRRRVSIAALEVHCDASAMERLVDKYKKKPPADASQDTDEWRRARELYRLDVPPIVAVIYDGEMSPDNGRFPHPHINRTLQWGFLVHNMRTKRVVTVLMTLEELAEPPKPARPDIPCYVYSFKTEQELLRNICMFMRVLRPSCHIHWNGNNFDLPWLYERARFLGLCCARDFGSRVRRKDLYWKSGQGAGKRLINQVYMPGTICLDGMLFAQVERSTLGSYSLNFMGELLLNQHKVDLDHARIPDMQQTPEGRAGLAEYLLGDIYLTWCICVAMNMLPNLTQRSQLTYTSIQNLIQRGTQYMELNLLRHRMHRKAMNRFYGSHINVMVLPCLRPPRLDPVILAQKGRKAEYDGAVVIEPFKGFYRQVVFTLDYGSLYPSLMYHYNLCLSTTVLPLLAKKQGAVLDEHTWRRPNHIFHKAHIEEIPCEKNPIFLKHHVFCGVFPEITQWLKTKRKAVKREMAIEEDIYVRSKRENQTHAPDGRSLEEIAARIKVLDIIQNQIKLIMNSIYGFMGLHRTRGEAALPNTAETVTLMGQHAIHTARIATETSFCREKGYDFQLGIIYGDTDSVFGRMIMDGRPETTALARNEYFMMEIGVLMANAVTKIFKGGLELQFEKIYNPFLLMGKKNYVGNKKEPNGSVKIDKKGIRAKRRDCCDMQRDVTQVVEKYIVKNYNFQAALDHVSEILARIQRYEEPLHRAVFSGSFTGSLLEPGRPMNAPAYAMLKLYQRTGQLCQPGNRVLYVFVEQPRLKTGSKSAGKSNIDSAESLEYVQQHGLRYDREDYIKRVIKAVLPMMSHVARSEWKCTFSEAEDRLTKMWMTRIQQMTVTDRTSDLINNKSASCLIRSVGVRIQPRCIECKRTLPVTIETTPEQSAENPQTLATLSSCSTSEDTTEYRVQRMCVRSLGGATQLRFKGLDVHALAEEQLQNGVVHRRLHQVLLSYGGLFKTHNTRIPLEPHAVTQIRISGRSLRDTLYRSNDYRAYHNEKQAPSRLCDECQSHLEERTKERDQLKREIIKYNQNASQYWDKCRSCSASRMRAAGTVAECTTYTCEIYSNTAHCSRQVARLSAQLRERWVADPRLLEW